MVYPDYDSLPKANLILVTHEHGDHLDIKAIDAIRTADTKIVCNAASAKTVLLIGTRQFSWARSLNCFSVVIVFNCIISGLLFLYNTYQYNTTPEDFLDLKFIFFIHRNFFFFGHRSKQSQ